MADNNENQSTFEDLVKVPIYSTSAIYGFCVFFTTLFGGVLLRQNLKDIGKNKEGNTVLLFSIVYTVFGMVVMNMVDTQISSLPILLNIVGGTILNVFFFKKYFPNETEYPKKKIWKPLIISIIITIPFVILLIYSAKNS